MWSSNTSIYLQARTSKVELKDLFSLWTDYVRISNWWNDGWHSRAFRVLEMMTSRIQTSLGSLTKSHGFRAGTCKIQSFQLGCQNSSGLSLRSPEEYVKKKYLKGKGLAFVCGLLSWRSLYFSTHTWFTELLCHVGEHLASSFPPGRLISVYEDIFTDGDDIHKSFDWIQ